MFQYLVILLDDTSVSYCHYENLRTEHRLMALDDLKAGILVAMKENLTIQFVYPDYELPQKYKDMIHTIDHIDIVSSRCEDMELKSNAEIVVCYNWTELGGYAFREDGVYVLRTDKERLFENASLLKPILAKVARLNVVITDVESFTEQDLGVYGNMLNSLLETVENLYVEGKAPQLNLLTDRMMLDKMNNCNAGWETITLAPDGKFYVCPAFYAAGENEDFGLGKTRFNVGNLEHGLDIKNPQLYQLNHAPLCRNCDAYQCRRCVWLNRKMTYEVNTPSREQCVMAHLERNASRKLLEHIRRHGAFLPMQEMKEIDYLDPFEVRKEW